MLPALTTQQLAYLVAVDEFDTWRQAAEALGVSPSALSQGLAELQRRLGVDLFVRQGRTQVARPEAATVTAYARTVLGLTADLDRWATGLRTGQAGRLSLGMIDVAALHHLADPVRRFRDDHPGIDIRLTVAPSGGLLDDLRAGHLDLAVGVAPPDDDPDLEIEPLLDEPLYVYGITPAEAQDPRTWGPWVSFPATSHTRRMIDRALTAIGADPRVVAESHQPEVLRELVALGQGWTVLPAAQAEAGDRPLVARRTTPLLHRTIALMRRRTAAPHPAADRMAAALLAARRPRTDPPAT